MFGKRSFKKSTIVMDLDGCPWKSSVYQLIFFQCHVKTYLIYTDWNGKSLYTEYTVTPSPSIKWSSLVMDTEVAISSMGMGFSVIWYTATTMGRHGVHVWRASWGSKKITPWKINMGTWKWPNRKGTSSSKPPWLWVSMWIFRGVTCQEATTGTLRAAYMVMGWWG